MTFNAPLRRLALALLLGASVPAVALAQDAAPAPVDPSAVVATANGIVVTEGDLALAAEDPALPLPGMDEAQRREVLIGFMIDLKLGARAAEEAALAEGDDFARRLAYQRDKLLLDALLEQTTEAAVTEQAARALYDETIAGVEPEDEVRARHILVPTQEEAQAAADRIAAGEPFETVAGELSQDPGSAARGGDLGFFTKERMVAPFAEAAFALEPGAVSQPVESQFGWHVIKVEERRQRPVPTFEELREQIDTYLGRQAQQQLILSLRESAQIERVGQTAPDPETESEAPETAPAPAPQ